MKEAENKMSWDRFEDHIDRDKFEIHGIAELSRRYVKDGRYKREPTANKDEISNAAKGIIVAKGVTAYLSYTNEGTNNRSLRSRLVDKNTIELEEEIFQYYLDKNYKVLTETNNKEPFKYKRKTRTELFEIHIENEKQFFNESKLFFDEVNEWEILIIKQIKDAALYYMVWLKENSNNIQPDQQTEAKTEIIDNTESETILVNTETSKTKSEILDLFDLIDTNRGWKYAFRNETDYNTFFDLLTCYFDDKPYTLPQQEISLNRKCKTRFAKTFNKIYYKSSNPKKKLISDREFFNIIRILNHFKDSTDVQIYKLITG